MSMTLLVGMGWSRIDIADTMSNLLHHSAHGSAILQTLQATQSLTQLVWLVAGAAQGAQPATGGGLSAEEMQAAMRSVEDETDAAAAAALEQENAAELAEFTLEPASQVSRGF